MLTNINHRRIGSVSTYRNKIFKMFANSFDEQNKSHIENMRMLGLDIKKLNYSSKTKKKNDQIDKFI